MVENKLTRRLSKSYQFLSVTTLLLAKPYNVTCFELNQKMFPSCEIVCLTAH